MGVIERPKNTFGKSRPPGLLERSVYALQLFGHLAVVETHSLWYFGHHCCLGIIADMAFWIFARFHPFLPFLQTFFAHFHHIYSFSRLISPLSSSPLWSKEVLRGCLVGKCALCSFLLEWCSRLAERLSE